MGRIIAGGLLGGLLIFLWGFVSHMFLPLGMMGMVETDDAKAMPVIEAMGANFDRDGIYLLPFMPEADWQDEAKSKAFGERAVTIPQAFVVFHQKGEDINANFGRMLGIQFGSDVLGALLAAIVASFLVGSYFQRVILITLMGAFAWVSISVPYWNWYRFPLDFTLANLTEYVVGYFIAGLAIAWLVKPRTT
ncbi:MAG TPA: hypothetical protein VFL14_04895 [Xanthomonadales bacterium]|nr:hypothetical protein [Xanthomonadales bacterium]